MEISQRTLIVVLALALVHAFLPAANADSRFFKIESIRFLAKPPKDGTGVWIDGNSISGKPDIFAPCLEVEISAAQTTRTSNLRIRAYFFDEKGQIVKSMSAPSAARQEANALRKFEKPVILNGGKPERVFFKLPDELAEKKWKAAVVFGDTQELTARSLPGEAMFSLEFPEKQRAQKIPDPTAKRAETVNPVIEHVVKTNNSKHPQITLFLRFPNGGRDGTSVDGAMAICVLANNIEDIRRMLQTASMPDQGGIFRFADNHRFAVLCWGARTVWRPDASYDELERETNIELDRSFDQLADAWERGILELNKKYNLPTRNFLLRGSCASAQWAHRLALRKPDYFLAASLHIPSSFDRPTLDGAKVLWLLTAGERDGGYQHGNRWYQDCRAAGYPIIYKPIVGLGHAGSPIADDLSLRFFEYALTLRNQRAELDKTWPETKKQPNAQRPWLESFRQPEFMGDFMNQEVFPLARQDRIPAKFRVPLPTKTIADAWNK